MHVRDIRSDALASQRPRFQCTVYKHPEYRADAFAPSVLAHGHSLPLSSHAYTLARLPLLPPPSSAQMPDFCLAPLKRTFPHTYRYFRSTLSEERPGAWGKGRRSKVTPTRWRAYRNGMHTAMGHARMLPWDAPDLCLLLYNVTAHGSHNREGVQCCSCHVTLLSPGIAAKPTYVGQGGERSKKFFVETDSLVSNEPRS